MINEGAIRASNCNPICFATICGLLTREKRGCSPLFFRFLFPDILYFEQQVSKLRSSQSKALLCLPECVYYLFLVNLTHKNKPSVILWWTEYTLRLHPLFLFSLYHHTLTGAAVFFLFLFDLFPFSSSLWQWSIGLTTKRVNAFRVEVLGSNVKSYGSRIRTLDLLTWDLRPMAIALAIYIFYFFVFFFFLFETVKEKLETKTTTAQGVVKTGLDAHTTGLNDTQQLRWYGVAWLCARPHHLVGVRGVAFAFRGRLRESPLFLQVFFLPTFLFFAQLLPHTLVAWFTIHDPAIGDGVGSNDTREPHH